MSSKDREKFQGKKKSEAKNKIWLESFTKIK